MSKGSERRPSAVSGDHYRNEHDRIFGTPLTRSLNAYVKWLAEDELPRRVESEHKLTHLMAGRCMLGIPDCPCDGTD